jgi:small subunit ribosomal protein S7
VPRRAAAQIRPIEPDPIHRSRLVSQVVNKVMLHGKKSTAENIVYDALSIIAERTGRDPVEYVEQSVKILTPQLEVRSRRVGGATYQVPVEVRLERRQALAIRWLIQAARARNDKTMVERLSSELLDASNNRGNAVKKREDTHRMAEANRAFSHYRW